MNTEFIQQSCIKFIKSDNIDICNVKKVECKRKKKMITVFTKILSSTNVFNINK